MFRFQRGAREDDAGPPAATNSGTSGIASPVPANEEQATLTSPRIIFNVPGLKAAEGHAAPTKPTSNTSSGSARTAQVERTTLARDALQAKSPYSTRVVSPFQSSAQSETALPTQSHFLDLPGAQDDCEGMLAWQNDIASLDVSQSSLQADQINLLHSHLLILSRELGNFQKHVLSLSQKVDDDAEATQEIGEKLRSELQKAYSEHDQKLEDFNAQHNERHALNADVLESGLQDVMTSYDRKMQAELTEFRSTVDGSNGSVRKVLTHVTEHVEALTSSVEKEQELRTALDAKLHKMCEALRIDVSSKQQELLGLLKSDGAGKGSLSKIQTDAIQQVECLERAVEQEHKLRIAVETRMDQMLNLQQKLVTEMQEKMKGVIKDHSALKLELAQNSGTNDNIKAALEDARTALKGELQQSQWTLRDELAAHKRSTEDRHRDVQDALKSLNDQFSAKNAMNTEQFEAGAENVVSSTDAKLQRELQLLKAGGAGSPEEQHQVMIDVISQVENLQQCFEDMRIAVEAKLESVLNEQHKTVSDLRKGMQDVLNDTQSARLEIAECSRHNNEVKAAVEQALLQNELAARAEREHAAKMEEGLQNLVTATHVKLQQELQVLKAGGAGSMEDLGKILADVNQEVETLEQTARRERDLRVALDAKVDKILREQNDSHEALKLQIAQSNEEVKAAVEEALVQSDSAARTAREHAAETAAGLQTILAGKHVWVQEDPLESDGINLKDMSHKLTEVSQQVKDLDTAMQSLQSAFVQQLDEAMQSLQNETWSQVKEKMDKILAEQEKTVVELKNDVIKVAVEESQNLLKMEIADHGKTNNNISIEIAAAHTALKDEIDRHRQTINEHVIKDGELISACETRLHSELQNAAAVHKDMVQKLNEEHSQKYLALESSLDRGLANVHEKLQQKLKESDSSPTDTADLTKQVETFRLVLEAMQEGLEKMCKDLRQEYLAALTMKETALKEADSKLYADFAQQFALQERTLDAMQCELDKMGADLRHERETALTELRQEHSTAMTAKQTFMMEAHTSLHAEMTAQSSASLSALEKQLRQDLKETSNDVEACQRLFQAMNSKQGAKYATFEQRLVAIEARRSEENDISGMRENIQDMYNAIKEREAQTMEIHKSALEERTEFLQMQLKETADSHNMLQGQFRAEILRREKALTSLEARIGKVENFHTEIDDRRAGDMEEVDARVCEIVNKFGQQRYHFENHKALVDQRLAALDQHVGEGITVMESRMSKIELYHAETTHKHLIEVEEVNARVSELLNRSNQHRSVFENQKAIVDQNLAALDRAVSEGRNAFENHRAIVEQTLATLEAAVAEGRHAFQSFTGEMDQRLPLLDRAVSDGADLHHQALSACRAELGQELLHVMTVERGAREILEKTVSECIHDLRMQSRNLEGMVLSIANQLKDTGMLYRGLPTMQRVSPEQLSHQESMGTLPEAARNLPGFDRGRDGSDSSATPRAPYGADSSATPRAPYGADSSATPRAPYGADSSATPHAPYGADSSGTPRAPYGAASVGTPRAPSSPALSVSRQTGPPVQRLGSSRPGSIGAPSAPESRGLGSSSPRLGSSVAAPATPESRGLGSSSPRLGSSSKAPASPERRELTEDVLIRMGPGTEPSVRIPATAPRSSYSAKDLTVVSPPSSGRLIPAKAVSRSTPNMMTRATR